MIGATPHHVYNMYISEHTHRLVDIPNSAQILLLALCSGIILGGTQRIICGTRDSTWVNSLQRLCQALYNIFSPSMQCCNEFKCVCIRATVLRFYELDYLTHFLGKHNYSKNIPFLCKVYYYLEYLYVHL